MKSYLSIFLNNLSVTLTYKLNLLTGIFSNLISVIISFFVWKSIFAFQPEHATIGGYTESKMLLYIVTVNLLSIIFSSEHIVRLGGLVRTGKLTTWLLRPVNLLGESFATFLGQKVIYIASFSFLYFFFVRENHYLCSRLLLLADTMVAFVMFFLLISVISTLGFWMIQMWPIRPIMNAAYLLLGGLYFPLNLLPESIFQFAQYTPFAMVGYQLSNALQGTLNNQAVTINTLICFCYGLLFWMLYRLLFHKGLAKFEGMGS